MYVYINENNFQGIYTRRCDNDIKIITQKGNFFFYIKIIINNAHLHFK